MMELLSVCDKTFAQVIAVDARFDIFSRAWCVSELAKAHSMGMQQHLKLLNYRSLEDHAQRLRSLRVESMQASRPEDVLEILSGIPDVAAFNKQLQTILF